tara:strand:- start:41099 stop:41596 length:498 start_codon:yes stop_codon:yes gene_type:complete
MKICFIDLETTGLDWKRHRVWQIAGSIRKNGRIIKKFNFIDRRSERNLYVQFKAMLNKVVDKYDPDDKMFFVAYNAIFDSSFIREMFTRNDNLFFGSYFFNPYICLMQMVARYFMKNPKKRRPDNFKLGTVCRYFGIKVQENRLHDGAYDVDISRKLYNKMHRAV